MEMITREQRMQEVHTGMLCSSDPPLLTCWSWSTMDWTQTWNPVMNSSNCCDPAKPNSLHPNHNTSWYIYRYFVCRRFLVQTCSCGWKPCFHGRCSLPPCHQGLLFTLLENLPHVSENTKRWPWVPPQRYQNKRQKMQGKLSVHAARENQSGNEE